MKEKRKGLYFVSRFLVFTAMLVFCGGYMAQPSDIYGNERLTVPQNEENAFTYRLDHAKNAVITKYNGAVAALTIPDELDGHPVAAIDERAFKENEALCSVIISNGVESIGKEAFYGCSRLSDVILPENSKYTEIAEGVFANTASLSQIQIPKYVTSIGKRAFYQCGLEVIHLNEDITYIGTEAFYGCAGLSDLILPKYLEKFGAACFGNCNLLRSVEIGKYVKENDYYPDYHAMADKDVMRGMFYGCDNLKDITFAQGVTMIGHNLLNGCTGIEEITIPDTVTFIGAHAFHACTSLREVHLPNSLTGIDALAFRKCTALECIYIPDSVTEIGCCAFRYCENLTEAHLPQKLKKLGTWAFGGCTSLQSITIPPNLTEVQQYYDGMLTSTTESPFVGCTGLKEVKLEAGMKKVADSLFRNFAGLEKIVLPHSVIQIGASAFHNASGLKETALSSNLVQVGDKSFLGCSSLEKIELPDTVKSMGSSVFEGCSLLSEVKLPKYGVSIAEGMFKNCISLKKIEFPDLLRFIYAYAFEGCEKLEKITLPEGFLEIGRYAFLNCKRLAGAELKGKSIANYAFQNCGELTDVKMADSIDTIGKGAFSNCSSLKQLRLSTGITAIAPNTFEGCTYLDQLVIPYAVTEIGEAAFKNCTRLKNITIPGRTKQISDQAFSYPEDVTVYGVSGSYTQEYAQNKHMTFFPKAEEIKEFDFLEKSITVRLYNHMKAAITIQPVDCGMDVIWKSSDEEIATVSDAGVVQAMEEGSCTVTAQIGSIKKSCQVTVEKMLYVSLEGRKTMQTGTEQKLSCTQNDGSFLHANEFIWWSNDPTIAAIDPEGKVRALKMGKVLIEAWLLEDVNRKFEFELEVKEFVPIVSVTGISLNESALSMKAGQKHQLKAEIFPADADNRNIAWNSDNLEVASVENGSITAKKAGTACITVTAEDGGWKAACQITVMKDGNEQDTEHPDNNSGSNSGNHSGSNSGDDSGSHSNNGCPGVTEPTEQTNGNAPKPSVNTVKKPSVPKVKFFQAKAGKKRLTLSWKKVSKAAGYQLQIGTRKNWKGAKTRTISKSKTSCTQKGLKAKKKYYVRIRAYKTYRDANGKQQRAFGTWTKLNKKTK